MSWDMGILSSFPLYLKICSCSGRTQHCEERPGSLPPFWPWLTGDYFAAGWHGLPWLKPPGELNRSLLLPKIGNVAAISGVERFYRPTCWRLPLTPLAEFTPGQSLWSRSSWTRRIRTLVCDSLDASQLLSFSYCVLRFSQLPSFVQNISTFPYFDQTPSPPSVTFPKMSNVKSSSTEMLRGNSTSYHVSNWAIINISNWQTLLLIRTPVPSLYTTLWNANTRYEMSPSFYPQDPISVITSKTWQ